MSRNHLLKDKRFYSILQFKKPFVLIQLQKMHAIYFQYNTVSNSKGMTRIGRRLIEDFLLPALNDQRYGELLKWVDREKRHFSIRWSHKNAAKWTLADTAVFQDWDKLKGHYRPEIKGYYMQAKQRFRAALYKLNSVRKLPCEDKHVKKYQLIMDLDRRRDLITRPKVKKEENQKSIPTSVIRKNTSYIEKPKTVYMEEEEEEEEEVYPLSPSPPPPSPTSSERSDVSEDQEELKRVLFEYTLAQKKQMMQGSYANDDCPAKEASEVLRENTMGQRTPHVPLQQVPVYSGSVKHFYDSSQKRFESPRVLLVKTFNDLSEDEQPIVKEEPIDYEMQCTIGNSPDIALNLSVKSEDIETLSR